MIVLFYFTKEYYNIINKMKKQRTRHRSQSVAICAEDMAECGGRPRPLEK